MDKGERLRGESVFSTLYLRGIGAPGVLDILRFAGVGSLGSGSDIRTRGSHFGKLLGGWAGLARRWPRVESVLRLESPSLGAVASALRRHGLWDEAAVLDEPGRLALGEALVSAGFCRTVWSLDYPAKWRLVLGSGAPPAVWCWDGGQPDVRGAEDDACLGGVESDVTAVVGGRAVDDAHLLWATAVGSAVAACGQRFVSGGAVGVDRAALAGYCGGGGLGWEILPCGIGFRRAGLVKESGMEGRKGRWLSVCGWDEGFTTAGAMERNALIYAMADRAVVIGPRMKTGGTWHGATDALRRRLSRVYVALDGSAAVRAMVGLGAQGLRVSGDAEDMAEIWRAECLSNERDWSGGQPDLFGGLVVREGGNLDYSGVSYGDLDLRDVRGLRSPLKTG